MSCRDSLCTEGGQELTLVVIRVIVRRCYSQVMGVVMRIERDGLYTLQELSEVLGVSLRTLQRLVAGGDLPARKLGRRVMVRGDDLLAGLPGYRSASMGKTKL